MDYLDQSVKPGEGFILLADDDDDDRLLMDHFFCKNGYKCKLLPSGLDAIHFLQSLSPASYPFLILLDYSMPVLNGEEVLLKIKSSDALKRIPVIIYSTEMNEGLKCRLEALGAYTCFAKAYEASQLNQMKVAIESLQLSGGSLYYSA